MALKPKFEAPANHTLDDNTAVAEDPANSTTDSAAAAAQTSTALARASATSLSVQEAASRAKEFQREVQDMKGASDFSYGNYDVFKGNNGVIQQMGGDEADLGRWAKVRLLAWDEHFEISPGTQDKTSKDFVAYSKDGRTIDSVIGDDQKRFVGRTEEEYLTYLKNDEGFGEAKVRRFIDTACALLGTDSGEGPIGRVIQVTLSESSIPAFSKYQQELTDNARCVAMGLPGWSLPEDPFTFFFLREMASKGTNRWTRLKIVSTLPAKL